MTITPRELRALRVTNEIPGVLLATHAEFDRGRLSLIEKGRVRPRSGELEKLHQALTGLIAARQKVAAVAREVGWPL